LIERIAGDPILANTKIIAEAWDAAGLYQVGSFYKSRWAEWNGRFRDDIRRYMRGDMGMISALATRFSGSSDLYRNSGRRPYHSINFITSHDGFTLIDLVSYNHKHNMANGEDNRDGTNDNFSWNCGAEGTTDNQGIMNLRWQLIKNYATLLLLSQGVPMIMAGDEFGRTQRGNNNAYCQDNKVSWVDWTLAEKNKHLLRFFQLLIHYRRLHPVFRRGHFFVGEETGQSQLKDITWYGINLDKHKWEKDAKCLSVLLNGMAITGKQKDDDFFLMINGDQHSHDYSIPEPSSGKKWLRIIDTHLPSPDDIQPEHSAIEISSGQKYHVKDRTIVVLISKPQYYSQIREAVI
jgi:glycogen operon protein